MVLFYSWQVPRASHIIFKAICIDEEKRCSKTNKGDQAYVRDCHYVAAHKDQEEKPARLHQSNSFISDEANTFQLMSEVGAKPKDKQVDRKKNEP